MKKIISILAAGTLIFSGINAGAADVSVEDFINGVIKIKGTTEAGGENVNILVLNPGETPENAENDYTLQQFSNGVSSDENGRYTVYVKLKDGYSGSFPVYIKEGSNEVKQYGVYYATMDEKIKAADELTKADNIKEKLEEVKNILSLDIKIINDIDTAKCAENLKKSFVQNPLSFDTENPRSEDNIKALNDLNNRIKTYALLEAYNQGVKEAIFFEDQMLYDDITGLSSIQNTTVYKLSAEKLSSEGLNKVVDSMLKKSFDSVEDLQTAFAKGVIFYGISCNNEIGYGHIDEYITSENVKFAYGNDDSVKDYLSLNDTEKEKVNAIIKRNQNSLTVENYLAKVNEYAKQSKQTKPEQGGSSNSGSSGGSSQLYAPGATDTIIGEDITFKDKFSDLENALWAKEAIEYLSDANILNGVGDGKFAPGSNLTREQAAKIICEAFKIDIENGDTGFDDVTAGAWYEKYIASAKKAGIVNGLDEKIFGVGRSITRQDIAVLLYRTLGKHNDSAQISFTDVDEISEYAKEAVAYFVSEGILNGYEDGSFKPNNYITRAEAAKLIYNILKGE